MKKVQKYSFSLFCTLDSDPYSISGSSYSNSVNMDPLRIWIWNPGFETIFCYSCFGTQVFTDLEIFAKTVPESYEMYNFIHEKVQFFKEAGSRSLIMTTNPDLTCLFNMDPDSANKFRIRSDPDP